jgi:hypothetical protein
MYLQISYVTFGILTAVTVKITALWGVKQCSLADFQGTSCILETIQQTKQYHILEDSNLWR